MARCRRRPSSSAGGAPGPIPSMASGRKKSCPCYEARPLAGSGQRLLSSTLRQAQEEDRHPDRFSASQLRTLQRRLQALRQAQEAGTQRPGPGGLLPPRASTWPGGVSRLPPLQLSGSNHRRPALPPPAVPAGVEPFPVLSHSGWRYAEVVASETFLSLKQGLQNALWELGGAPQVIRSDNTSALTHEIKCSRCTPTPWIVNELGLGIGVTGRGAVEGRGSVSGAAPVGGTSSVVRRRRG